MTRPVQTGFLNAFDNMSSSRAEVEADRAERDAAHERAVAARATITRDTSEITAALPTGVTLAEARNPSTAEAALNRARRHLDEVRSTRSPSTEEQINRLRGALHPDDRPVFDSAIALGCNPDEPTPEMAERVARIMRAAPAVMAAWRQAFQIQSRASDSVLSRRESIAEAEEAVAAASNLLRGIQALRGRIDHLASAEAALADARADEAAYEAEIGEDRAQFEGDLQSQLTQALGELTTLTERSATATRVATNTTSRVIEGLAAVGLGAGAIAQIDSYRSAHSRGEERVSSLERAVAATERAIASATVIEGESTAIMEQVREWFSANVVPNIADPAQQAMFNENPAAYSLFVERYRRRENLRAQLLTQNTQLDNARATQATLARQIEALTAARSSDLPLMNRTADDMAARLAAATERVNHLRSELAWVRGTR